MKQVHISIVQGDDVYIVVNETLAGSPKARGHIAAQPMMVEEVQLWLRTEKGDKRIGEVEKAEIHGVAELVLDPSAKVAKIMVGLRGKRVFSCVICDVLSPEMFLVPDEEWKKYVIPPLQNKWLCRSCYDDQKRLFPNGWKWFGEENDTK